MNISVVDPSPQATEEVITSGAFEDTESEETIEGDISQEENTAGSFVPEQDNQEEEDPIGALLSDPVFNQAPLSLRLSDSDKSEFFELVLRQKSLAREAAALSVDLSE